MNYEIALKTLPTVCSPQCVLDDLYRSGKFRWSRRNSFGCYALAA